MTHKMQGHRIDTAAFSNLARRLARHLNSSRPRPISSIRSPRRNPERRLSSDEHHLGPNVLATISGTASGLCSPGNSVVLKLVYTVACRPCIIPS